MAHAAPRSNLTDATRDVARFQALLQDPATGAHAYVVLLGLETFDFESLLRAIRQGLPYRVIERFEKNTTLSQEALGELLDIPRRTLTRRKSEGRLQPDESDRLLRAARVFAGVLSLFEGNRDAALDWLSTPKPALSGAVPLVIARTNLGAREVEDLTGRLEHGVFA